jgi:hypothetical protein
MTLEAVGNLAGGDGNAGGGATSMIKRGLW